MIKRFLLIYLGALQIVRSQDTRSIHLANNHPHAYLDLVAEIEQASRGQSRVRQVMRQISTDVLIYDTPRRGRQEDTCRRIGEAAAHKNRIRIALGVVGIRPTRKHIRTGSSARDDARVDYDQTGGGLRPANKIRQLCDS